MWHWQWWPAWSDQPPLWPRSLGLGPSQKCPRPSDHSHRHSQGQGPVIWWSFTIWRPVHHIAGPLVLGANSSKAWALSTAWCDVMRGGGEGVLSSSSLSVSADWPCALPLAWCSNGWWLTKLPIIAHFLGKRSQRYLSFWLYCPLYRGESL